MKNKLTKLGLFFELIKDNSWHSINELSTILNVSPDRLSKMSSLLAEHDLIEYKQDKEEVKINQKWKLINEEYNESEEQKQAVGTIIVPPRKNVKLQCTTITNLTDIALELNVRIDRKLEEITISKAT